MWFVCYEKDVRLIRAGLGTREGLLRIETIASLGGAREGMDPERWNIPGDCSTA